MESRIACPSAQLPLSSDVKSEDPRLLGEQSRSTQRCAWVLTPLSTASTSGSAFD